MISVNFTQRLNDAIENYYNYNPDTLMPLLMVSLAVQGRLKSSVKQSENSDVLCKINLQNVIDYDWVRLDPSLRNRVNETIELGAETICIEGFIDDSLRDIYDIFHKYDTNTVNEEFHHRMGILYEHSSKKESDEAHRQYASISLAEELIDLPKEWLKENFLEVYNYVLVRSGLQPKRPRLNVAYALQTLLQYDGVGKVYNPFAGCAIAAAAIPAGENMYADGNDNDKLFAVARLLNYGMGGSNSNFAQRDSSKWIEGKFDYVLSTYRGYVNGKSAFDFCLSKCFDTLADGGKYAGIVSPKEIFENPTGEFKEALKRDWVDTIVLLPFGEVAVLVNTRKNKVLKSKIRFFDLTHPMLRSRDIKAIICDNDYAQILRVSDVKKKGFLRSLVVPAIVERDGYDIIKLGDVVRKLRRQTFSLDKVKKEARALASIDRRKIYDRYGKLWMNGIEKTVISSLFAPAYHLKTDSLITNVRGHLEPRLFDSDQGTAYFQDGYAFKLCDPFNASWIIEELNEPYVLRQLHPYGMDEMVPEFITEDQILNLKLYREKENYNLCEDCDGIDFSADKLPSGYELTDNNTIYTIRKFLGNGSFGYAYSAMSKNLVTGEEREVVLKEFYPFNDFHREGEDYKAVANDYTRFNIAVEKEKFRNEAEIMRRLGNTPNSHIVPVEGFFESEKTDTMYYVMPFYRLGSLEDLQKSGTIFTEDLLLKSIIKPLCTALHIAHKSNVLHLDIKPENILIDDNGDAVLTDFGVAKQYDEGGSIINREGVHGTSCFAAPEMRVKGSAMVRFGGEPDIYALSATLYNIITQCSPHPIQYNSDEDRDLRDNMGQENLSEGFINAIIAGLQAAAPARPRDAQAFLNCFPGFEDVRL